jgi:hypothetical protein
VSVRLWFLLYFPRSFELMICCSCARHSHMIQRSAPGYRPVTMSAFGPMPGSLNRSQSGHVVDWSRSTRESTGLLSQGASDPQSPASPAEPLSPTSGRETPASSREDADDEGDGVGAAALASRPSRRFDSTGRWSQGTLGQYACFYLLWLLVRAVTNVVILQATSDTVSTCLFDNDVFVLSSTTRARVGP